ncbi:MAG: AMP-forming long-chain acyl-CoA synthetase [Bacteroidetes bacterium]|nr:MAG: AMP-forming long-chain acyl-CoA synthetase [Bacteroidota bacterium]
MDVKRLFDILPNYQEKFGNKPDALAGKVKGVWVKYSLSQCIEYANNIAYGLLHLGLQKGDRVIIMSNNRPEWNFIDFGTQLAGGILVPVYPTISENDLQFILKDSESAFVFVSSKELFDKVKNAGAGLSSIKGIYAIDTFEGGTNWNELLDAGKKNAAPEKVKTITDGIGPNDLVTILYTSGTTGTPKGVMLSHNNLVSNFYACRHLTPANETSLALSFLPLNHVYERMKIFMYLFLGTSVYYAESLDTIGDNMREVKPHIFTAVPRLLEKVYDRIVGKGQELKGFRRWMFFWALDLGLKYEIKGANGWWYGFKLKIARKLVFSKWQAGLGGRVLAVASGGAALQPRLARVFWAAGIPVLEGYGLTETSPVIAVNQMNEENLRFGTVGPVIEGVQVKIAEDGEILVKGPNVMLGYYKRPDATAEVIDAEGWFHTGDIGEFVEGKFLKITDRKKELFKTSGGKYIAPQMIENKLKESRFIEQCMVIGENQKFPSVLIIPAYDFVADWAARKSLKFGSREEMVAHPEVIKRVQEELDNVNKGLAQYESIKKFKLLANPWTVEAGQMTPKLSLRRKIIGNENKKLIDEMYGVAE